MSAARWPHSAPLPQFRVTTGRPAPDNLVNLPEGVTGVMALGVSRCQRDSPTPRFQS